MSFKIKKSNAAKNKTTAAIASDKGIIRRFLSFYKSYKKVLFFDLSCALIMSLCSLEFPILVRKLLYDIIGSDNIATSSLLSVMAIMLGVKLLEYSAKYYVATVGHIMGVRLETDIRQSLYDKYLRLQTSFFDEHKIGELMSRSTTDLFDITEFSHHGPEELFIMTVKLVGIFAYLLTINVPMTLALFACLPVIVIVAYYFNKKMQKVWTENRKQIAVINSQLEESLSGIRVIKSFNAESAEREKFAHNNLEFIKIKKHSYRYMGLYVSITGLLSNLLYVFTAIVGAFAIIYDHINSVDIITYLLYISVLLQTVDTIVNFTEQFQQGMSGFKRYIEIMDTPETITDSINAIDAGELKGDICFENVDFAYSDNEHKVINNLNLNIHAGEHIAIVGPSGSGKTTMANLLPRFYDIIKGKITIDGHNIKDYTLNSLRRNIGVVQQDVYLFNGTIKENVAFGRANATDKEIINAVKLAGAYDFIEKMPDGFNTQIGERGTKLSGGQKQRLSIARAFIKNPPILILDEATSSLDNVTEKLLQNSLKQLTEGRTTLTIAHRLTTIRDADRIFVLTDNGIAEEGTHEQLMNKNGYYYSLYV